jgi:hypothetical protein
VGQTLDDLNLHEQFDAQVVGLLDRSAGDEQPRVRFGAKRIAGTTLVVGDTLLVYGHEKNLDALERAAMEQEAAQ